MADGLYDADILVWSERQADLLRRLAAGERVNEEIDWPHLIEEVRDLGASELRSCRSWLELSFIHLLKIAAWPDDLAVKPWRTEVENFAKQFASHYVNSMRHKLDWEALYANALQEVRSLPWPNPRPLPDACPFTVEDFTAPGATTTALLAKLAPPA